MSITVSPPYLGNKEVLLTQISSEIEEDNKDKTKRLLETINDLKTDIDLAVKITPKLIPFDLIKRIAVSMDEAGQKITMSINSIYGPVFLLPECLMQRQ
jgi:hypothetical protein